MNDTGVNNLIGALVDLSLKDLFTKQISYRGKTAKQKEKIKVRNRKIRRNKAMAKLFFEKSLLFELTGLDFQALKERYVKEHNIKRACLI